MTDDPNKPQRIPPSLVTPVRNLISCWAGPGKGAEFSNPNQVETAMDELCVFIQQFDLGEFNDLGIATPKPQPRMMINGSGDTHTDAAARGATGERKAALEEAARVAEECHKVINFVGSTSVIGPAIAEKIRALAARESTAPPVAWLVECRPLDGSDTWKWLGQPRKSEISARKMAYGNPAYEYRVTPLMVRSFAESTSPRKDTPTDDDEDENTAKAQAAIAYQICSVLNAPVRILDYFSAVANGEPIPPNPLPFSPDEVTIEGSLGGAPAEKTATPEEK
jgi:hypothetical protein